MTKEIFDIVDEEDQIIGQAARDQVHGNPNLIHRVVHILVFNSQNELYLQKRDINKDVQPGKWDTSVGGHVDKGESYRDAAVREMEEELGIKDAPLNYLYKYRLRNDYESEYVSSYHCLWDGPIKINVDEIEEGRFWRLDEIAEKMDSGIFTPNFIDEIGRYQNNIMKIREAEKRDWAAIWPIFNEIVKAGETYAYQTDTTKEQGEKIWLEAPRKTFVFEEDNRILGTYYIKTNQAGPGSHVCNCGYMVSTAARGKGIATSMCEHSQQIAKELGYKAMQFNFVASSNEEAVRLWGTLGFETVGRLPKAFNHPSKGYVDALVMYKWLET